MVMMSGDDILRFVRVSCGDEFEILLPCTSRLEKYRSMVSDMMDLTL